MIALISLIFFLITPILGDFNDYTYFLIAYPARHCEARSNRELYRADLHGRFASVRLLRTSQ
ncbi:hypothetical protein HYN43_024640 [Mucilaginibacter celer]|uniref:Uncharacterized protein n=1 Tax=Mucilaginibacter celer TaxID=2305508 RepID=A0A494W440_9SPHI|nr:hypothetical protein HYN43_024640 [Mucilaginibacter celer]